MQFASQIREAHDVDLSTVFEPHSVIKGKLKRRSYEYWVQTLSRCAFVCPLSCVSSKIAPGIGSAKDKIKEETQLLPALEQWQNRRQLPRETYIGLSQAEVYAWNLWLDKLTDHVKTVSRGNGIDAAVHSIVRFLVCFLSFFTSSASLRVDASFLAVLLDRLPGTIVGWRLRWYVYSIKCPHTGRNQAS